jgi:hypothetical protein
MESQGTGKSMERALVLDAGALIALEKGDQSTAGLLEAALNLALPIVVPASVLAQVWRGGPSAAPLQRVLAAGIVDALDEERAKEVGLRLGLRRVADIANAHVVCCAIDLQATAITSDESDLRALRAAGEQLALISV